MPALAAGFQNNASSPQGLEGLLGALSGGQHQRYVDDVGTLEQADTVADGNGILGHIFGSKDVSRQVASQAASQTGIGEGVLKAMLPVVAAMMMGAMSKRVGATRRNGRWRRNGRRAARHADARTRCQSRWIDGR